MNRIIDKVVVFLRWLLASETLPTDAVAADASRDASVREPGFSRWLLKRDKLNAAALRSRTRSMRFVRWLLASETLRTDVVAADASRDTSVRAPGFSRWLLKGDILNASALGSRTKPVRFVRWILSPEEPYPVVTEPFETRGRPQRFWRWLLRGEEIPPSDAEDGGSPWRTMFLQRLLTSEACPVDPDGPIKRPGGFLLGLLEAEQCPRHPAAAPLVKKGFAWSLLEQEDCPVDSTSAPVRRRGFWRKLLAPEKL